MAIAMALALTFTVARRCAAGCSPGAVAARIIAAIATVRIVAAIATAGVVAAIATARIVAAIAVAAATAAVYGVAGADLPAADVRRAALAAGTIIVGADASQIADQHVGSGTREGKRCAILAVAIAFDLLRAA
jgi:hypothetical protein